MRKVLVLLSIPALYLPTTLPVVRPLSSHLNIVSATDYSTPLFAVLLTVGKLGRSNLSEVCFRKSDSRPPTVLTKQSLAKTPLDLHLKATLSRLIPRHGAGPGRSATGSPKRAWTGPVVYSVLREAKFKLLLVSSYFAYSGSQLEHLGLLHRSISFSAKSKMMTSQDKESKLSLTTH